jgi:AraC-like DNA-binding protein
MSKESLLALCDALESIPPFDDPNRRYTLNGSFASGKCGDYSRMLQYVMANLGYEAALTRNRLPGPDHIALLVKTNDGVQLVDWTQSQFFGHRHFRGNFDELVTSVMEDKQLTARDQAVEVIQHYYGFSSQEEMEAKFKERYVSQPRAAENIYASRWMATTERMDHDPNDPREFDFNRDVMPKIGQYANQEKSAQAPQRSDWGQMALDEKAASANRTRSGPGN